MLFNSSPERAIVSSSSSVPKNPLLLSSFFSGTGIWISSKESGDDVSFSVISTGVSSIDSGISARASGDSSMISGISTAASSFTSGVSSMVSGISAKASGDSSMVSGISTAASSFTSGTSVSVIPDVWSATLQFFNVSKSVLRLLISFIVDEY